MVHPINSRSFGHAKGKYQVLFLVFLTLFFLIFPLIQFVQPSPFQEEIWIERTVQREFSMYLKKGISRECIEDAWEKLRAKPSYRRYKIIDSKVYGQPGAIKNLLELIVANDSFPNLDFIYSNKARIKKHSTKHKAPIFVSAKDASFSQFILFSDWEYDPQDKQNGWNAILRSINENQSQWPWETKIEKLFWRGPPSDGKRYGSYRSDNWKSIPRGNLVYQSHQFSQLIDAAFSSYPPLWATEDLAGCKLELGPLSDLPLSDQLCFKYQILIDGITCTSQETYWKLLSGCVPFKQQTSDQMYFYPELIAWKHYIPVKQDLSDLLNKIQWAREHDSKAKQIARNARKFALTHLMPEQILSYCRAALLHYAALQTFQPTLAPYNPADTGRQF